MGSPGVPNPVSNTDGKEVRYEQQETHCPLRGDRAVRHHLRRAEIRNDAGRRPPSPPPSPWSLGLGAASAASASAHVSWLVHAAPTAPAAALPASLLVRRGCRLTASPLVEARERRGRVCAGRLPGDTRPEHFVQQLRTPHIGANKKMLKFLVILIRRPHIV